MGYTIIGDDDNDRHSVEPQYVIELIDLIESDEE